jgi:hypothetical protein
MYQEQIAVAVTADLDLIEGRDKCGAFTNPPDNIKVLVGLVRETLGWGTGFADLNSWGGLEAHNMVVYGYDECRDLAVIQISRSWKKRGARFMTNSTAYALVGLVSDYLYSHPLASSPRRNPRLHSMEPKEVVRWAEVKIFGATIASLDSVIWQGDIFKIAL